MTDWAAYRAEFPALETQAYLNTAAGAPMSRAAAAAAMQYYEATERDGDVHWDDWLERVEAVRAAAAHLLGADSGEIAFVQNASAAMTLVAARLQGRGDVVLVRGDFPSVTYPWMVSGHNVVFAEPGVHGGATLEELERVVTPATGIVSVGLVQYRTGFRYDLRALGEFCRERELLLVVDVTQGLGAVGVDLSHGDVDFLVSSGYKWLTSGYGFGPATSGSPRATDSACYTRRRATWIPRPTPLPVGAARAIRMRSSRMCSISVTKPARSNWGTLRLLRSSDWARPWNCCRRSAPRRSRTAFST